ncbi:MAG TPA: Uma2 family endonuclease [Bryobacteraceae bacterium]|nr:Uma2 family endonuclease [Bryobacteraceae bacterium]
MSFEEFEQIPETPRGFPYELRHGELVQVPPPSRQHYLAQRRLRRYLEKSASSAGEVDIEMPFRPLPDFEYWYADVAFVSRTRWDQSPVEKHLEGAPDLVVEVLSPSNTAAEILDRRNICLENGSREFWLVDIEHRQLEVSTPDGRSITYKAGQSIPLFFAPGVTLSVDSIFE